MKIIIFKYLFTFIFSTIFFSGFIFSQDSSDSFFNGYEIVTAGNYSASSVKRFFAGDHWRNLWITPIKVPFLDLKKFAGGLTPFEKGGGLQTKSLKFKGNDGREYRFRAVDKDVSRSLPPDFKGSVVNDVMQDQVSVTNPSSSIIVAPLMDAVGILNAKPIMCLMPDDEQLGEFRNEFAGVLGTIEEDPEDYENKELNFAGADKIVNTFKLYEKLQEDNDEKVDAVEFLKARLFDVFIGDRDRHAGQWNWAGYPLANGKGKKKPGNQFPKTGILLSRFMMVYFREL